MKLYLVILGSILLIYLLICICIYKNQEKMMYHPNKSFHPEFKNIKFPNKTVFLKTGDKLTLKAYYSAPKYEDMPTIIFFQGNTGNPQDHMYKLVPLVEAGFGVLIAGYRGFDKNPGKPTEEGLLLDAMAAVSYVRSQSGEKAKIFYYGLSLGTAVSVKLSTEIEPMGMILEGGFTSIANVGQYKYKWLPVKFIIRDKYDSLTKIKNYKNPVLFLHGKEDKTVPFLMAEQMLNATKSEDKQLISYENGGHTDLDQFDIATTIIKWVGEKSVK